MDQDLWSILKFVEVSPERVILKMYLVESKAGAIACMLFSLLFLGTWPALLTLLERRGRLPQHTYLDYTITNLLSATLIAFTVGEIGRSTMGQPNFFTQLSQVQDNWPSVLFAIAGGVVLTLGNLSTQYAWAFVGLSVTEVITASITVVIGTTFNYYLDDKINKAEILFPGVGCFLIAVCLGSAVHASNAADNKEKLAYFSNDSKNGVGTKGVTDSKQINTNTVDMNELENGEQKAKAGTALFLIEVENKRAMKALPLVSTFWAVILFGEYRRSSGRTYTLLAGMLIMFIAAVAILMASAGKRK